ncbi:hypothetical protein GOP47_0026690 [Adiantum capillus-veneris]|nr:hypothetical protein GOP47_0026690 [Adiantum capillus-veneris]
MAFPPQSPQHPLHPPDIHTHVSKLRKALTCSLCNQLFQKPACLHCNHHFCMSCLLQSMKEMSACPQCKHPAATRQARFAPEMDNLVDIFKDMESAAGPVVANSEDSQLENLPDMAFNVKIEDECLSPSALKRQRRYENRERLSSISAGATNADSRKRDASSMELPCRGLFPAPKRIQLPCPPLPTDRSKVLDASIEDIVPTTDPTLDPMSVDINSNTLQEQQKQPLFAHARIGGQVRSTGSAVSSQDGKVPMSMAIQSSNCEQPKASGDSLEKRNECAPLHSNDPAQVQERIGMHAGPMNQTLPGFHKQDVEMQAGSAHEQLVDGNARLNSMLPSQADLGSERVTCAFCHTSDSKVAGPMIHYKKGVAVSGSKRTGQIFSVHKNCAEWAPGVYYEDDIAKNIPQEVARGHKIKCHVCGLRGAVLGCYVKRCRKSFHYPCAHTLPCRWDDSNFLVFCPEHIASRFPDEGPTGSSLKSSVHVLNSGLKDEKPNQVLYADGGGHQSNGCSVAAAPVDAYIPRLPGEVETCNREPSQQWPFSKWVICGTGLSPRANELLTTFVSSFGLTIEKTWSSFVTHLIVGTDEVGAARRTFKYLMANLEGKWILKIDWISACIAANQCLNEEPYEVNLDIHGMIGGPRHARGMAVAKMHKLFHGLRFYFLGEYTAAYRADLQSLLTNGGGLVLAQMPDLSERDQKECIVILYSKDMYPDTSASHKEELNKSKYLEAKSLAGMMGAKVAGHTWILDSVAAYELQPFE